MKVDRMSLTPLNSFRLSLTPLMSFRARGRPPKRRSGLRFLRLLLPAGDAQVQKWRVLPGETNSFGRRGPGKARKAWISSAIGFTRGLPLKKKPKPDFSGLGLRAGQHSKDAT